MTHFLLAREKRVGYLRRPLAAVTVRAAKKGKDRVLIVQTSDEVKHPIGVLKVGVTLAPLPSGVKVLDDEGEPIAPSHGFWVTTETLDPYHMLIDAEDPC